MSEETQSEEQTKAPETPKAGGDRSLEGMEDLLQQTEQAVANETSEEASSFSPQPLQLSELAEQAEGPGAKSIELLNDVDLDLRIELGRTHMRLEDVLQLRSGSVVALDRLAGDPVDVFVNGRLVAKGEVLVLNENFCVRVTELVGGGTR